MTSNPNYKTDIPLEAEKVDLVEVPGNGYVISGAEYLINGEKVGERYWNEYGFLCQEFAMKNGEKNGRCYDFSFGGKLSLVEPYFEGKPHGVAIQFSESGKVMGTYELKHGSGIDLWRDHFDGQKNNPVYLAEVHYLKDWVQDGFSWFINEDQKSVWMESFFSKSHLHGYVGIERQWDIEVASLDKGYPKFSIGDEEVTKEAYQLICKEDPSLLPYREADDSPERTFPPEIEAHLYSPPNDVEPNTN
ncbi:MAG: hypothetical protein ACI97A_002048 [Planctomycetota bacterium]|jgi:hypothetical protein